MIIFAIWLIAYLLLFFNIKSYNEAYWKNLLAVKSYEKFKNQNNENEYIKSYEILESINNYSFVEKDYNKILLKSIKANNDKNRTKEELINLLNDNCYKKNNIKENLKNDEKEICAKWHYNLWKLFISLATKDIKNKDYYFNKAIDNFNISNSIIVNQKIKDNLEIIRKIIAEEKDIFQSEYDNFVTADNKQGDLANENNHLKDSEEKEEQNSNLRIDDEKQQFDHKMNNENQWNPTWSLYGEFTWKKTDEIKENDKSGADDKDYLREQKATNSRVEGEWLWNRKENEYGDENPYFENEKKKNQEKQLDTFFSNQEIQMEKNNKEVDNYYIDMLIKDEIKYKRKF